MNMLSPQNCLLSLKLCTKKYVSIIFDNFDIFWDYVMIAYSLIKMIEIINPKISLIKDMIFDTVDLQYSSLYLIFSTGFAC